MSPLVTGMDVPRPPSTISWGGRSRSLSSAPRINRSGVDRPPQPETPLPVLLRDQPFATRLIAAGKDRRAGDVQVGSSRQQRLLLGYSPRLSGPGWKAGPSASSQCRGGSGPPKSQPSPRLHYAAGPPLRDVGDRCGADRRPHKARTAAEMQTTTRVRNQPAPIDTSRFNFTPLVAYSRILLPNWRGHTSGGWRRM